MFEGAERKLSLAEYFLNKLKLLANEAGGFANIKMDKKHEVVVNLDGFLFEVMSAKDFFLQGLNKQYGLQFGKKQDATNTSQILQQLRAKNDGSLNNVIKAVEALHRRLTKKGRWLWRLNHYRNSATHRELVHFWNVAEGPTIEVKEGEEPQFQIVLDPETKAPKYLRRIDIPSDVYEFKNLGTYLLKDPSDPDKGRADVGVIEYCEKSLDNMGKLLNHLYAELQV